MGRRWWMLALLVASCQDRPFTVDHTPPSSPRGEVATLTGALTVASACAAPRPGQGWTTHALSNQMGAFELDFDVTPAASPTDSVFGLVHGQARGYADLAALVRFAPSGLIDVRNGSAYTADAIFPYQAGVDYRVHMNVDVSRHIYSVWVTAPRQPTVLLASTFAFRTEQAAVTSLDGYAAFLDPEATGGFTACAVVARPAVALPGCAHAIHGGGFVTTPMFGQSGTFTVELDATPSVSPTDAVVGLTRYLADRYSDLATAVRFATTGQIDVRRGGAYAALASLPYVAGKTYHLKMTVNVPAHTYSVWAAPRGSAPVQLAADFPFRTEQATVTLLGGYAAEVDPAAAGTLDVCGFAFGGDPTCNDLSAGGAWLSRPVDPHVGHFMAEVDAAPDQNIDAVVGFSSGFATGDDSLAVAGRFSPTPTSDNASGTIQLQNGDSFVDMGWHYGDRAHGYFYRFLFDVDMSSHTYRPLVSPVGVEPWRQYPTFAFRSAQAQAGALGMLGAHVTGGGGMTVCRPVTMTEGQPLFSAVGERFDHLAGARGGAVFLSRPGQTIIVDTRTGQALTRWPFGGVVDAHGYIADRFEGTTIGDGSSPYLVRVTDGVIGLKTRLTSLPTAMASYSDALFLAGPEGVQVFNTEHLALEFQSGPPVKDVAVDYGETAVVVGDLPGSPPSAFVDHWADPSTRLSRQVLTSDQQIHLERVAASLSYFGYAIGGSFLGTADLACNGQRWTNPGSTPIGFVVRYDDAGHCTVTLFPELTSVTALAGDAQSELLVGGPRQSGGFAFGKINSFHSPAGWWKSGSEVPAGALVNVFLDGPGHAFVLTAPAQDDPGVARLSAFAP